MRSVLFPTLLLALLALAGCGKDAPAPVTARTYADLGASLDEARTESKKLLGENGELARAVWDQVPGAAAWSEAALAEIAARRPILERVRDREEFCPGYVGATEFQKNTCWLRLFSAMARFESNFRPSATYQETSGTTSVGLLMMNPAHCSSAPTVEQLQDPVANIQCAAARLELLAGRDGWLSGAGNLGGAAYWSVLRVPYHSGNLMLGRKPHIQLFTRSYRGFRDPSSVAP